MEGSKAHASQLILVGLLLVVVAFGTLARKLRLPYPLVLLVAGLLVSFVRDERRINDEVLREIQRDLDLQEARLRPARR